MNVPRVREVDSTKVEDLAKTLRVSRSAARVLVQRGIVDDRGARDWLDARLAGLTDPSKMVDRDTAAARLSDAIARRERIAIFGDYDVDGTTATAILTGILRELGAEVAPFVAQRFDGGYGLSDPALDRILAARPSLLVTCDCGSADHDRVARARAQGVDVIVVDHHLVPKETLPALAFLNPHRPDCGFPYKGLASAGLALSLGAAVRAIKKSSLDLRTYLDLVALGTVADVAPLDGDNRRLVRAGLARLAQPTRPGIAALREVAKIKPGSFIGGIDIAFRMAPRLNAAGRLGNAASTLSLLLADELGRAQSIALEIESLNDERKALQRQMTEHAVQMVREQHAENPSGIVVASESFHRGVVGIVAARLVELFEAPAVVIALDEHGVGHGSGRTLAGFPLYDAVARCKDDLDGFGGHQAALGVHLRAHQVERFRASFHDACEALRREHTIAYDRVVDVRLDGQEFTVPTATELGYFEPVGAGNPEPRFLIERARVDDARSVGTGHLKLSLKLGSTKLPAFGYDMASELDALGGEVTVWGSLRPDTYRGGESVELRLDRVHHG